MKTLSPRMMENVVSFDCKKSNFKDLLGPLNQPRVVGSQGSKEAREHIVNTLETLGWEIELQEFTQDTRIGEQTFVNIIATYNKDSPRRLVLAAHYDSKISPQGFIGATDSAVPCAMLLKLADSLDTLLTKVEVTPELTLQLIFFDGEEAFVSWTADDSLYGSRYMADLWNRQPYNVKDGLGFCQSREETQLDRIDAFVLLDLIGAKEPIFRKYTIFDTSLYDEMENIEFKINLLNSSCEMPRVFVGGESDSNLGDDHRPFFNLGLKRILHMIANPFPSVWHTLDDNEASVDYPTVEYIQRLITVFAGGKSRPKRCLSRVRE